MDACSHRGLLSRRLQTCGHELLQAAERSPLLRAAVLNAINAGGGLLLLAPLLTLAGMALAVMSLAQTLEGPLDWFLLEVCAAVGLIAAWLSYRLLGLRPAAADGIDLEAHREPRLFQMLERRLSHFALRPFEHVQLTTGTGIRVTARPRRLFPAWHRYTLSIGAPLLFFISEAQFRLALAGAVAASASARRGLAGWAQQAARDWPVIIETLAQHGGLAARLLLPALHWIDARNRMLGAGRETDQLQAQAQWILEHTDEHTTRALLSSQVLATAFVTSHYWPMMLKGAELCAQPVVRPFSHFDLLLKGSYSEHTARRWLLRAQAAFNEARYALQDMLAELRIDFLQSPALPARNAFECIFESTAVLKQLDQHWRERIRPEWQQRHTEFQAEKTRFDELLKQLEQQALRGDSAINCVRLAQKFLEPQQAIPVIRKVYRANPDDAAVSFNCGEALLAAGHSLEGCDALQRAADLDTGLASRAQTLIRQHQQGWLQRDLARSA